MVYLWDGFKPQHNKLQKLTLDVKIYLCDLRDHSFFFVSGLFDPKFAAASSQQRTPAQMKLLSSHRKSKFGLTVLLWREAVKQRVLTQLWPRVAALHRRQVCVSSGHRCRTRLRQSDASQRPGDAPIGERRMKAWWSIRRKNTNKTQT